MQRYGRSGTAWVAMALGILAAAVGVQAAGPEDPLVERIRQTPPTAVPLSTWRGWADALRERIGEADRQSDPGRLRDLALFTARMQAENGRDAAGALATLRDARHRLRTHPDTDTRALFLAESALLVRVGDREAIRRLMGEYRASPQYRPEPFTYSGGQGREDPLRIRRPQGAGLEDPVLMTLERHVREASASAGERFPDFELRDVEGRVRRLSDYRGRWLLVDVWVSGSTPWQNDLPARVRAWNRWGGRGFEVLGVSQNLDAAGIERARRTFPDMTWPQVDRREAASLLRQLGLFGDATTLLIDPEGRVAARDLRGAEWADVLDRVLGGAAR